MKRIRVEEINGIIYIDGIDIIKKVSELSKENDRLYLENKRQKEVIDKIKNVQIKMPKSTFSYDYMIYRSKIDEILKEVEQ